MRKSSSPDGMPSLVTIAVTTAILFGFLILFERSGILPPHLTPKWLTGLSVWIEYRVYDLTLSFRQLF